MSTLGAGLMLVVAGVKVALHVYLSACLSFCAPEPDFFTPTVPED